MDSSAIHKISYGLFVVTSRDAQFDNGCVGNVCVQVASSPTRLALALNKLNKTCWMVKNSGTFNVSILSESAPFALFQPGKALEDVLQRAGDLLRSHILYVAELEDAQTLSSEPSMTYDYYHQHVKPKPNGAKVKGWRCKICGYVHEGEDLPPDFICPTCKHGAEDFEKIQ